VISANGNGCRRGVNTKFPVCICVWLALAAETSQTPFRLLCVVCLSTHLNGPVAERSAVLTPMEVWGTVLEWTHLTPLEYPYQRWSRALMCTCGQRVLWSTVQWKCPPGSTRRQGKGDELPVLILFIAPSSTHRTTLINGTGPRSKYFIEP